MDGGIDGVRAYAPVRLAQVDVIGIGQQALEATARQQRLEQRPGLGDPLFQNLDTSLASGGHLGIGGGSGSGAGALGTIGTIGTNFGTNHKIAIEEQQIIAILKTNPKSTQKNIQEQMKISIRSVKRIMADLQGKGVIIRKGNNRTGEWIVLENERYQ